MADMYGVRLTACGPDRLGVLMHVRECLKLSPVASKARLDGGPFVLVDDVSRFSALQLEAELERLGASAEVFVSTPCPCCGQPNHV